MHAFLPPSLMAMFRRAALLLAATLLLGACATSRPSMSLLDLGPLPAQSGAPAALALSLAEVETPVWLNSPAFHYRLLYANAQQPRAYAYSRWSMAPGLLLDQRLRQRIVAGGGTVVQDSDGATGLPLLRVEADDFSQHFTAPAASVARVTLRATLYQGRRLVAQKTFAHEAPAQGADAAAGAAAMRVAAEQAIGDLLAWLAGTPAKK